MLSGLLQEDRVKLNVECLDWKEALTIASEALISSGDIMDSYLEAIIANFEEMGPYMVVAPGIVLSHARPENGVINLSMTLTTLKTPINFGNPINDPVKLIITLAAKDNDSHLRALSQLMELLMNSKDLEQIVKATSKDEVLSIIKEYSKN